MTSEESRNFSTTMMGDDSVEATGGKEIRPPILPSNLDKIYVINFK